MCQPRQWCKLPRLLLYLVDRPGYLYLALNVTRAALYIYCTFMSPRDRPEALTAVVAVLPVNHKATIGFTGYS